MQSTDGSRHETLPQDTPPRLRFTDIVPLPSSRASLFSSHLFLPGLYTAAIVCILFLASDRPDWYFRAVSYYIVLMIVTMFYQASGLRLRAVSLAVAAGIVALILWGGPTLDAFFYVFRTLPAIPEPTTNAFLPNFIKMFVEAGLMEELLKAIPTLLALVLALVLLRGEPNGAKGWLASRIGVSRPMEGLMMGLAAGGAFTLVETLEQYVPNMRLATARDVAMTVERLMSNVPDDPVLQQSLTEVIQLASEQSGIASGVFLLMPRVLGALIGHMSYAGIFGYFIGLAGQHRGLATLPLVLIGWVLASAIHGTWNSVTTNMTMTATAIASFVILLSYYMKAQPASAGRGEGT